MACLLVYEHVNNTQVDKASALQEYSQQESTKAVTGDQQDKPDAVSKKHEQAIRPYPTLPDVNLPILNPNQSNHAFTEESKRPSDQA